MPHKHDCSTCIYLGECDGSDLYYHPGKFETLIARHSSDGPDYSSGLAFSRPYTDITGQRHPGIPELVEARRLAEAKGLLK